MPPAPFKNLMVATDFSPGASEALARAGRLPLADGSKLRVVHVLPSRLPKKAGVTLARVARRGLEQAAATLTTVASASGRRHLEITAELCHGPSHLKIAERASSTGAELIVLGRHSLKPLQDMFVGATAERVIRSTALPVLVVARRVTGKYRRPLVAVDLEQTNREVVRLALRLLGPEVRAAAMVHAYRVPFEGFLTPGASATQTTDLRQHFHHEAARSLARLHASLSELGIHWETAIVRGDAQTVIVGEAIRRRADLLTIGTHGRKGLKRALIGSVAEGVLQAAVCDVLVARTSPAAAR